MGNELAVKTVDFMGDGLLAARDEKGVIWTGVNSFCQGIGLNKNERDRQVKNVQSDEVLKRGCVKFDAGVFDPNNETLALQLDYVPLWLAKISITPNMRENNPELVEKLVNYQLKAKDVLAAAFLPQAHNVKRLTITSRDIATMLSDKKKHAFVLNEIRDIIVELEEMGFDVSEFFIESTYRGGNNQDGRPQYLCTERGCERFSWRLEPEERRVFLQEFMDRFDRMKGVLDGKPVKRAQIDEDKETVIRIFRNNNWGILLMDNEVYNMTPEEIDMISRFVPEMQKRGIDRVKKVLCAFMESMSRGGKLEEIASWGVEREETPTRPLLVDKAPQNPKQRLHTDSSVDLNSIENLTELQAKTRYNVGHNRIREISDEIGAVVRVGVRRLYSRQILDDYFKRCME